MKQKKKLSTGSATSEKVNRTLSHFSFMDSVEYEIVFNKYSLTY
jgi:hypothetical protein